MAIRAHITPDPNNTRSMDSMRPAKNSKQARSDDFWPVYFHGRDDRI